MDLPVREEEPLMVDTTAERSALDSLPIGVLELDDDGIVLWANTSFEQWAGRPVAGRRFEDVLVGVDDFLDGAGTTLRTMVSAANPDRAAFVMHQQRAGGSHKFVIDASERMSAGLHLKQSFALASRTRQRLQLVIDASIALSDAASEAVLAEILAGTTARAYAAEQSGVFLLKPDGRFELAAGTNPIAHFFEEEQFANAARNLHLVLKVSGLEEGEAVSPALADAMRASGIEAIVAAPIHHDDVALGAFACFFYHPRTFDEEATPLAEALAGQAGQTITALRLTEQLEHLAMHDETTGLPNRRLLERRVSELQPRERAAVIFLDLDGFKEVNDLLGHDRGDDVLREVSRRLRQVVREEDAVARFGGDEFVVILVDADDATATDVAERLRVAIAAPFPFLPGELRLSASIGIAAGVAVDRRAPIDRLIRVADQAMYRAKAQGGNQIAQ